MIFIVILLQIVILSMLWYISDYLIPIRANSKMTYEYILGFLTRFCAENPDYGKSVFPETWEKIQKGDNK